MGRGEGGREKSGGDQQVLIPINTGRTRDRAAPPAAADDKLNGKRGKDILGMERNGRRLPKKSNENPREERRAEHDITSIKTRQTSLDEK